MNRFYPTVAAVGLVFLAGACVAPDNGKASAAAQANAPAAPAAAEPVVSAPPA